MRTSNGLVKPTADTNVTVRRFLCRDALPNMSGHDTIHILDRGVSEPMGTEREWVLGTLVIKGLRIVDLIRDTWR